jgi:hypothetical protein
MNETTKTDDETQETHRLIKELVDNFAWVMKDEFQKKVPQWGQGLPGAGAEFGRLLLLLKNQVQELTASYHDMKDAGTSEVLKKKMADVTRRCAHIANFAAMIAACNVTENKARLARLEEQERQDG